MKGKTKRIILMIITLFTVSSLFAQSRAPYIQNPTQTTVILAWRTVDNETGRVEYREFGSPQIQTENQNNQTKEHHVTLSGLTADTRYRYNVYSGGQAILIGGTFNTAPQDNDNNFSFLILGDSGMGNTAQKEVLNAIKDNIAGIDFIIHVGDVHQGNDDGDYDRVFFKPYESLISNINMFTTLGNHDWTDNNRRAYFDSFYLPGNERYYSFRWSNALFIALDTNPLVYRDGGFNAQRDFLQTELKSTTADQIFVYMHHPAYTNANDSWYHIEGQHIREIFVPLFEEYGVDLVMSGHIHCYEQGILNGVIYITSGGGGADLVACDVDRYHHMDSIEGSHHFVRVDVHGSSVKITPIDTDGEPLIEGNDYVLDYLYPDSLVATLGPNYPNPFNSVTFITYTLPNTGHVKLVVYDLMGRMVSTLVNGIQHQGQQVVYFNGDNLPTGTYVYRFYVDTKVFTQTMTLMK